MMLYQLYFYVPQSHLETTKQALFKQGAGHIGDYADCSWQTLGQGQFKPSAHSHPYIGQQNQPETLAEYKVEILCEASVLPAVLTELIKVHPYETPAYGVIAIQTLADFQA